jgi:hypothetical protein
VRNDLDYGLVHHGTGVLFEALKRPGLTMALCYEDQSVKHMIAGGVGPSYGFIDDRGGAQYAETLALATSVKPAYVQIATWNDWGEGTSIEPSIEYGFRDLEKTQEVVRAQGGSVPGTAADLRLPLLRGPPRHCAAWSAAASTCTASRSISSFTFSPTATPPVSRRALKLTPKSLRLMVPRALRPATVLP